MTGWYTASPALWGSHSFSKLFSYRWCQCILMKTTCHLSSFFPELSLHSWDTSTALNLHQETQPATLPLWLFMYYSAVWSSISPGLSTFRILGRKWEALAWSLLHMSPVVNMLITPLGISHVQYLLSAANEKSCCSFKTWLLASICFVHITLILTTCLKSLPHVRTNLVSCFSFSQESSFPWWT